MTRLARLLFPPANTSDADLGLGASFGFTTLGVAFQGLARFAYALAIGHTAGKSHLGQTNLLISLAVFLVLFWPQSTAVAVSKYVAVARGRGDSRMHHAVTAFTARVAFTSSAILGLIAGAVAGIVLDSSWTYSVQVAVLVLALGCYNYVRCVRYGNIQFATGAAWDILSSVSSLIFLGLLLTSSRFHELLLAPLILSYTIATIAGWPRQRSQIEPEEKREILRFVAWGSVQMIAAGGLLQLTLLLASPHATEAQLGDFAAAVSLATPASLLAISLRTSLEPSVARAFASGDAIGAKQRVDELMHVMLLIFMPIFGIAILWAGPVLRAFYGTDYLSARSVFVLLLFGVSASSYAASHVWLLSTRDWGVRALALVNASGLIVGSGAALALSSRQGVAGAAIGFVIGAATSFLGATAIVWWKDRMPWGPIAFRLLIGYALLVACTSLQPHPSTIDRIVTTVVFLLVWTVASWPDLPTLTKSGTWTSPRSGLSSSTAAHADLPPG